ncbi:IclR family transcriptional regulator [Ancylobacter mangrovi]|uniref:IclR family transcriptional regulator n=1 Tax=Ancylobacter mangrovi TaxID=2972472 RepID=A0A9X2P934_9HYPH|nr:IclR family transcriptional regulator [Ancylobacter mangrovi]MCS0494487.1 IclR family transcriptional regulator [Ancylobacter mangrovi]MCS0500807.1 IclR family transcriptional regulator [Ancylobacter mangrovi]
MNEIGAINRVLRLVSLLSDYPHLNAKQAANLLGWPVSSTHRLLRKLAEHEFAEQTDGNFSPGMELYRIVGRLSGKMPFAEIAEPLLDALTRQFNETSMLTILERRQLRMYTAQAASPQDPMRYIVELNRRDPLVWGASGRALLAHLSPEEIDTAIATCTTTNIRGEVLDPAEVRAALEATLKEGFALSRSHRTLNSIGIAVPFFGPQGDVIGSVGFQIPGFRFREEQLAGLVEGLTQTALIISQQIGAKPNF